MRILYRFMFFISSLALFWWLKDIESHLWVLALLFYAVLGSTGALLFALAGRAWKKMPVHLLYSFVLTVFFLFLADLGLRYMLKVGLNWFEANHGVYKSVYDDPPRRYWLYKPNSVNIREKEEFTHRRRINALGLTQKGMQKSKPDSVFRILAMGDSFTEGMGTCYDSAWPARLEGILNQNCRSAYQVCNAGVAGSDPVFSYMLYKEKLAGYQADMLILCMNNSDMTDIAIRKGLGRYGPDSSVTYRQAPWWEPFHKSSIVFRIIAKGFFGIGHTMMSPTQAEARYKEAARELFALLDTWGRLCKERGCRLVVMLHPVEHEVRNGKYDPSLMKVHRELRTQEHYPYIDILEGIMRSGKITEENIRSYYWETDRHFTTQGYRLFARLAYGQLKAELNDHCR